MFKNTKSRLMAIIATALAVIVAFGVLGNASVAKAQGNTDDTTGKRPRLALHLAKDLLDATTKGTNLTKKDIAKGYKDGLTLRQQIQKAGGNVAAIKAAAADSAKAQIDEALSKGKINKDQAEKLRGKIDGGLDKLLDFIPKRFTKNS